MATRAKSKTTETAAIVTIRGPGKMSKRGRRDIAKWLRHHAECLLKYGDEYTEGRFTGRYMYRKSPGA